MMNDRIAREPRLLIPALGPLYEFTRPLVWLVVRVIVGLMLILHAWPKWQAGVSASTSTCRPDSCGRVPFTDPALMWGLMRLSVASHGRGRCSVDFELASEL